MKKVKSKKIVFKSDTRRQTLLFPPSLEELISSSHPVRFIDSFVDQMDLSDLLASYKGGGTSAYHPAVLLKLLLYGYLDRTYSSRDLEKQCLENICYMWLSGGQSPDHNTIARFRSERLQQDIKSIFKETVKLAHQEGIIQLNTQMVDGTKMESVANRYSFVWSKNIARFKGNLEEKIKALLKEIDDVIHVENPTEETPTEENPTEENPTEENPTEENPTEETKFVTSQDLTELINELEKVEEKRVQKIIKKINKDYLPRLKKYELDQQILNGRNSYSKTDPDATFMRMKEDHMKNGQLKPAYNWMNSTENQFIINYSIHQNPNDASCYLQHTDQTLELLYSLGLPSYKRAMGDAVFGTEENYEYLQSKGIDSFLKYPSYHKDKTKKVKNNPFLGRNFYYNLVEDFLVCPMGQHLNPIAKTKRNTKSGYQSNLVIYRAKNCQGCPLRSLCQPAKKEGKIKTNRTVTINHNLERHKQKAKENLDSLKGIRLRAKRPVDVEPPFGNIKHNNRFKRLTLKSIPKINVEIGLVSIAHNLKKIWKFFCNNKTGMSNKNNLPPYQAIGQIQQLFWLLFAYIFAGSLTKHQTMN